MFLGGLAAALLLGWFAFPAVLYQKVQQPLQFSHKVHAGDKVGLACEECHDFRADGSFTGLPPLEKCAGCHSSQLSDSPDEKILVEEYVTRNRPIPWLVYARQPQNAYFEHIQHVKLGGIACERCHGPHGVSEALPPFERNRISGYSRAIWGPNISGLKSHEWEGMKMDDCSRCHQDRGVGESCLGCHK
ncbi:MAG TPA: menaquinone reductase multiheme cytochrome c subunit QrcA [Bacteroidota bacterium]